MCGLEDTVVDGQFYKWYKELFEKYQDEKEKAEVIATTIKNATYLMTRGYRYTQTW